MSEKFKTPKEYAVYILDLFKDKTLAIKAVGLIQDSIGKEYPDITDEGNWEMGDYDPEWTTDSSYYDDLSKEYFKHVKQEIELL